MKNLFAQSLALLLTSMALACSSTESRTVPIQEELRVNALIGEMASDHELERLEAIRALGRMGPRAERAIPSLIRMLESEDSYVRESVGETLSKIGAPALEALFKKGSDSFFPLEFEAALGHFIIRDQLRTEELRALLKSMFWTDPDSRGRLFSLLGQKYVALIVKIMNDEDSDLWLRSSAIQALTRLKADEKSLIPKLLDLLQDKDEDLEIRESAAEALGRFTSNEAQIVKALLSIFRDKTEPESLRRSTLHGLASVGPSATLPLPDFLNLLYDLDSYWRWQMIFSISKLGTKVVPELIKVLKRNGPAGVLLAAIEALGEIGEDAKEAGPVLVDFLKGDKELLKTAALKALLETGTVPQSALKPLLSMIREGAGNRKLGLKALALLGPQAKEALPQLLELLEEEDDEFVEAQLVKNLMAVKPQKELLTGSFKRCLSKQDCSLYLQREIYRALLELHPESELWIQALVKSYEGNARFHGETMIFSRMGAKAVPGLLKALEDPGLDDCSRRFAIEALGELGPKGKKTIPMLLSYLESPRTELQIAALESLRQMGPELGLGIKKLVELQQHPSERVRLETSQVLGVIGPDAAPAIPALIKQLREGQYYSRTTAAYALSKIGAAAVPALEELLRAQLGELRSLAISSLGEMGEPARPSIPALLRLSADHCAYVRRSLAISLGELGSPSNRGLIQCLERLSKDGDEQVRIEARSALKKVLALRRPY